MLGYVFPCTISHVWKNAHVYNAVHTRTYTCAHAETPPRRFSRHGEQNFNDPRYQSRDERVSIDRRWDRTDRLRSVCTHCSLFVNAPWNRTVAYHVKYGIVDEIPAIWLPTTNNRHAGTCLWSLSVFFHSRHVLSIFPGGMQILRAVFLRITRTARGFQSILPRVLAGLLHLACLSHPSRVICHAYNVRPN